MNNKNILIAGAGGIGQASAVILADYKDLDCHIFIGDRISSIAMDFANAINDKCGKTVCTGFAFPEDGLSDDLIEILNQADIILDCLPGSQAPRLAKYADDYKCHYANLTEYVKETNLVTDIAKESDSGFILQTGLAPGYINILALYLFNSFTNKYNVDQVDIVDMKVGALSKHAQEPSFYAFTWSPIGVATEYIKEALVVENFETKKIPSLSSTETILINGIAYEDDYTSGGAADLPVALAGKTKNLRYKTLRYPGHFKWAKSVIDQTPQNIDPVEHLNETMLNLIPSVEQDVVVVFAAVKGKDSNGVLRQMEKSIHIYPSTIMGYKLRAIQTATAGPLCQAALMLLEGKLKGPVFQSDMNGEEFLNGPIVSSIFGKI